MEGSFGKRGGRVACGGLLEEKGKTKTKIRQERKGNGKREIEKKRRGSRVLAFSFLPLDSYRKIFKVFVLISLFFFLFVSLTLFSFLSRPPPLSLHLSFFTTPWRRVDEVEMRKSTVGKKERKRRRQGKEKKYHQVLVEARQFFPWKNPLSFDKSPDFLKSQWKQLTSWAPFDKDTSRQRLEYHFVHEYNTIVQDFSSFSILSYYQSLVDSSSHYQFWTSVHSSTSVFNSLAFIHSTRQFYQDEMYHEICRKDLYHNSSYIRLAHKGIDRCINSDYGIRSISPSGIVWSRVDNGKRDKENKGKEENDNDHDEEDHESKGKNKAGGEDTRCEDEEEERGEEEEEEREEGEEGDEDGEEGSRRTKRRGKEKETQNDKGKKKNKRKNKKKKIIETTGSDRATSRSKVQNIYQDMKTEFGKETFSLQTKIRKSNYSQSAINDERSLLKSIIKGLLKYNELIEDEMEAKVSSKRKKVETDNEDRNGEEYIVAGEEVNIGGNRTNLGKSKKAWRKNEKSNKNIKREEGKIRRVKQFNSHRFSSNHNHKIEIQGSHKEKKSQTYSVKEQQNSSKCKRDDNNCKTEKCKEMSSLQKKSVVLAPSLWKMEENLLSSNSNIYKSVFEERVPPMLLLYVAIQVVNSKVAVKRQIPSFRIQYSDIGDEIKKVYNTVEDELLQIKYLPHLPSPMWSAVTMEDSRHNEDFHPHLYQCSTSLDPSRDPSLAPRSSSNSHYLGDKERDKETGQERKWMRQAIQAKEKQLSRPQYMVFLLYLEGEPLSEEVLSLVNVVAPAFPFILFLKGDGAAFSQLIAQLNTKSIPQLLFFKDGLLEERYRGPKTIQSLTYFFMVNSRRVPVSVIPTPKSGLYPVKWSSLNYIALVYVLVTICFSVGRYFYITQRTCKKKMEERKKE